MKKLILLFTLLLTSYVFADHNSKYDLGQYNFYFLDLPGVCGTPAEVEKYTTAHEFEPTEVSLGRTDSSPDGEPVYMITMWANNKGERLATIDIPQGSERCMVFHSFNTTKIENGELTK